MITIYQIDFSDGMSYVGQTCHPLKDRIAHHASPNFVNGEVYTRLNDPAITHTIRQLSRHRQQERANEFEVKAILKLAKPLNIYVNGKKLDKSMASDSRPKTKGSWPTKCVPEPRPAITFAGHAKQVRHIPNFIVIAPDSTDFIPNARNAKTGMNVKNILS